MGSIIREIYILSSRRVAPIDIVYGSAVPILFKMMDITVPAGADIVFYAQQADGPVFRAEGWVAENTAGVTPPEGFFALGGNLLQVEINGRIIPIAVDVRCHERLSGVGSTDTPEQVRPLVQQALDAAKEATDRASAALESKNAAAGSASAAAGSAGAAAGSAREAGDAANAAGQAANAAAGSAQEAFDSKNAAAGSASAAADSAGAAAGSANAAAGSAQEAGEAANAAGQSANAAAGSAQDALESKNAAAVSAKTAQEAMQKTQAISVNPSYIGDNGNWFVWDTEQDSYVDSGVKAQGPKGDPGAVQTVCGVAPDAAGNVALTAENVGAATPEQLNAAVRKAAPRNLLDNSDFRNPVNQRGKTSYTNSGYTLDRWISQSSKITITINDGYIRAESSVTTPVHIRQHINRVFKEETKLTFAVKARGVSFGLCYYGTGAVMKDYDDWTIVVYNYTVPAGTDLSVSPNYNPLFTWSNGGYVEVQWAALYEGEYTAETLPEYQPKGYATELLECQRYFVRLNPIKKEYAGFGLAYSLGGTTAYGNLIIPNKLRANPSITLNGTLTLRGGTGSITCISISLDNYGGDCIVKYKMTLDSSAPSNAMFQVESSNTDVAYIDVIADI